MSPPNFYLRAGNLFRKMREFEIHAPAAVRQIENALKRAHREGRKAGMALRADEVILGDSKIAKVAQRVTDVIDRVESRCMAADGPVTPFKDEVMDSEMATIYKALRVILKKVNPDE